MYRINLKRKKGKGLKTYGIVVEGKGNKLITKLGYLKYDQRKNYKLISVKKRELAYWVARGGKVSDRLIKLLSGGLGL